jgi:DNA-binding response OmpR family regulator
VADILVVDDERNIREMLADFLRHRGHEVWEAIGGTHALSLLRRRRFQMILLDISMPGMSGIETLRKLGAHPSGPAVLMISGVADETAAVESLDLGASGFIRKPFDLEELEKVLERHLTPAS